MTNNVNRYQHNPLYIAQQQRNNNNNKTAILPSSTSQNHMLMSPSSSSTTTTSSLLSPQQQQQYSPTTKDANRVVNLHYNWTAMPNVASNYLTRRVINGFVYEIIICKERDFLVSCYQNLIGPAEDGNNTNNK
eukprot:UN03127